MKIGGEMIGTLLLFCHSIFHNCDKDSIEKKVKINQVRLIRGLSNSLFKIDRLVQFGRCSEKEQNNKSSKYKERRPHNPSRICFQIQPSKHNYYGTLMATK